MTDHVERDVTESIRSVWNERASHINRAGANCCKGCEMARQVPWLLAEVERLKANQRDDLDEILAAQAHKPDFAGAYQAIRERDHEELNRLRENQLPDGGEWRVDTGMQFEDGISWGSWSLLRDGRIGPVQRRIWIGPAEPLSKPSDTRPASTTDQTAPQTP